MKVCILAIALLIAGSVASLAQAPVGYAENGRILFTLSAPDFWSVRVNGPRRIADPEGGPMRPVPRVLALQPTTDDGVWMGFLSPPGVSTRQEARAYMAEVGKFVAFDSKVTNTVSRQIAGRAADVFSGVGRRNGRDIRFSIALIDLPGDRVAIAAAVVEAGTAPGFIDLINGVFASFRVGG